MTRPPVWPIAEPLHTARMLLEPLRVSHAAEAVMAFDDERLHTFTGGTPATLDELSARYTRQALGHSPDGRQGWLNWMLRRGDSRELVGTVQATLFLEPDGSTVAELAWVVAQQSQGHGYAREAVLAMSGWLAEHGVRGFVAHIHPEHGASMAVARAVGLSATSTVVDGETRWA